MNVAYYFSSLPSDRQHLSYDVHVDAKMGNKSELFWVDSCAQFLNLLVH